MRECTAANVTDTAIRAGAPLLVPSAAAGGGGRSGMMAGGLCWYQARPGLPWAGRLGFDGGGRETELIEAITHLAFYAGWPRAISAMAVAKEVFDQDDGTDEKET